jgi:hypothetical protein
MTHSGGKPHQVGDRGQRYRVTAHDHVHRRRIDVAYTNDLDMARGMRDSANMRPTWSDAKIEDRETEDDDVR